MTAQRFLVIDRLVESEGLQLVSRSISGGCHIRLRARAADGREEMFFLALSTSDRRSQNNFRSMLRRFARGHSTKTERKSP